MCILDWFNQIFDRFCAFSWVFHRFFSLSFLPINISNDEWMAKDFFFENSKYAIFHVFRNIFSNFTPYYSISFRVFFFYFPFSLVFSTFILKTPHNPICKLNNYIIVFLHFSPVVFYEIVFPWNEQLLLHSDTY